MSRSAVILRNIASNWIGFAVNAAVMLVLTPFILHELGTGRYGVWVLTTSVVGYYGLLDLGFRAGVTQHLTRYLAMRDYQKGSECMSSAVAALGVLGVLLAILSVAAAYVTPGFFNLPESMQHEAFWCILIVGITSAVQFALMPFTSIFTATQRFDLANLIGIVTRLLTAGFVFTALSMEYGLLGVSVATCGANLIDYFIRWYVAYRLAPELKISRQLVKLARLSEIASFGIWNFLISVNMFVYQYAPSILIGAFMPIAAVGHYALATGLLRHINSLLSPIGQVLYPAATELHVQGDRDRLERLYHDGSRLLMLAMIPIVLVAALWAKDFYRLWIGEEYIQGEPFPSVALLLQILLFSTASTYISNIAGFVLVGAGQVKLVAIALISGSVISLALSLILIQSYGLVGISISIVIASAFVDIFIIPFLLQRNLGLSVIRFLRYACVRPFIAGILQALLMVSIRLADQPTNWLHLLLQGLLAGTGALVILLSIGITAQERHRFLVSPLRRWLKRKNKSTDAETASC